MVLYDMRGTGGPPAPDNYNVLLQCNRFNSQSDTLLPTVIATA